MSKHGEKLCQPVVLSDPLIHLNTMCVAANEIFRQVFCPHTSALMN